MIPDASSFLLAVSPLASFLPLMAEPYFYWLGTKATSDEDKWKPQYFFFVRPLSFHTRRPPGGVAQDAPLFVDLSRLCLSSTYVSVETAAVCVGTWAVVGAVVCLCRSLTLWSRDVLREICGVHLGSHCVSEGVYGGPRYPHTSLITPNTPLLWTFCEI